MNLKKLMERAESEAHKEALAKGLTYKGFGYWADSSGNIVARSSGDKLEPVQGKQGGEEKKPKEKQQGGSFDQMMQAGQQSQQPETQQGEVKPGEEKVRKEKGDGSWQPGPDGDNSIDSPEEVEKDVFVQKTNMPDWTAGPEGDNYKNFSFDKFKAEAVQFSEGAEEDKIAAELGSMGQETPAQKAKRLNLTSDGHGRWFEATGELWGFTQGGDLVPASDKEKRDFANPPEMNRKDVVDMVGGKKTIPGPFKGDFQPAKDALAQRGPGTRADMMKDLGRTEPGEYGAEKGEYTKAMDAYRKATSMDQRLEDREAVKELNAMAKEYCFDPEYDLSDESLGEELGTGAFGSVYESADGENVIKDGEIGEEELKALDVLMENEFTPYLVNAEFREPFQSREERDGSTADSEDEFAGLAFFDTIKSAKGRFAMSMAKGFDLGNMEMYIGDEEGQDFAKREIWRARASIHKAGVAHNDMHSGNIFIDIDEDGWDESSPPRVQILDLGLARVDYMAALMEAIAGITLEDGQMSPKAMNGNLPQDLQDKMDENLAKFKDMIYDDYPETDEELTSEDFENLFLGKIRLQDEELAELRAKWEMDDESVQQYLEVLYDGIDVYGGEVNTADRMAAAFDKQKSYSDLAQDYKKNREGQEGFPKLNWDQAIPQENLDDDD